MTRINPDSRKPPKPEDVKVPPPRINRQKRKRMKADAEYNAVSDIYKEQNPACFVCGKQANLETDHIACGTARAASLLNSDTWINQCHECHQSGIPVEEKIAYKLANVVSSIERLRGRRLSDEQSEKLVDLFINAMAN